MPTKQQTRVFILHQAMHRQSLFYLSFCWIFKKNNFNLYRHTLYAQCSYWKYFKDWHYWCLLCRWLLQCCSGAAQSSERLTRVGAELGTAWVAGLQRETRILIIWSRSWSLMFTRFLLKSCARGSRLTSAEVSLTPRPRGLLLSMDPMLWLHHPLLQVIIKFASNYLSLFKAP